MSNAEKSSWRKFISIIDGAPSIEGRNTVFADPHDTSSSKETTAECLAHNEEHCKSLAYTSHEFKTPLNAIIGFAEMLERKSELGLSDEKCDEYIKLISQSAHHLCGVANNILDNSKISAGKYALNLSFFDIKDQIKSSIELVKPLALKANVDVVCSVPDDFPKIKADPQAIRQILLNLLSNAIKYSDPDSQVKVSVNRFGQKIQLEVSDCGSGISPEVLSRIGQEYLQDENRNPTVQGTGLGLKIVHDLVGLHKGKVKAVSNPQTGTKIIVDLPLAFKQSTPVPCEPANDIIYMEAENTKARELNLMPMGTQVCRMIK